MSIADAARKNAIGWLKRTQAARYGEGAITRVTAELGEAQPMEWVSGRDGITASQRQEAPLRYENASRTHGLDGLNCPKKRN